MDVDITEPGKSPSRPSARAKPNMPPCFEMFPDAIFLETLDGKDTGLQFRCVPGFGYTKDELLALFR